MRVIKKHIAILALVLPLLSFSQKVDNIHFEQAGKQIHIYYDLEGDQTYTVQIFCSTDNGKIWGNPLKYVSGAIGENQKPEKGKKIIWDVLEEREKLSGDISFKIEAIPLSGHFVDKRDGQTYKWVKIGKQVWMAENLNYKTYSGSWCYDNKATNCNKFGRLYNWKAASTACPDGWHLPTDDEWKTLEMYLGMSQSEADDTGWRGTDEGEKLKSTSGWNSGGNGTDAVGFTALPGGYPSTNGDFDYLGINGKWWSATEGIISDGAWYRNLYYGSSRVFRFHHDKEDGFSVQCVRD